MTTEKTVVNPVEVSIVDTLVSSKERPIDSVLTDVVNANEQLEAITSPFAKPWGNYLLENFVETQAPDAVSWVPSGSGWLLVLMFVFAYSVWKVYIAYQSYKAREYRRDAIAWLKGIDESQQERYLQLPALLKKVAIKAYGRTKVASLTGVEWEQWLDSECCNCDFESLCPGYLAQLSYGVSANLALQERNVLLSQVNIWIEHHRGCND